MKNLKRIDEAVGSLTERRAVNESTAKNVLKDAINALTKTFAGKKLDKAYVKDYIASMERMARKSPREFVKDYMNFSNDDWIEDVEYNMANENVNEGLLLQTVRKSIGKIQTALKKKWKKTGGYENFGQDEIRDLKSDGRWYNPYGDAEQRKAAKLIDALDQWAMNYVGESVDEGFRRSREPFTFTAKEVQDAADLIAKAITKMDKVKAAVHDMEYHEGEGASFEISMDGEKYEGGSYDVRPTGEVVNVAIGNSFPNAIYAKIGDKNINQIMKNIKKFESVKVDEGKKEDFEPHMMYDPKTGKGYKAETYEDHLRMGKMGYTHEKPEKVDEAAPRMKTSKETEELEKIKKLVVNARKGGMGNRYGKEFDRAKNKAVVALDNMISYSKIGS